MPIANITYNTVVTQVKDWIKANCKNIADFSNIGTQFKTGFIDTGTILNSPEYTGTYTVNITRFVSSVSSSTVDTEMENFCTDKGISNKLTTNIPASEFYHFIQDMISFICTKCVYVSSQFSQETRYLIYYTSNTTFSEVFDITSTEKQKLAEASDVESLMETMLTIANQNIRCIPCTYTWSFSE